MPRKQFRTDLGQVTKSGPNQIVTGVCEVNAGEDDGTIVFLFAHTNLERPISVTAGVRELSDYPTSHDYFIYAADDTPPAIAAALGSLPKTAGKNLRELLEIVSSVLHSQINSDGDVNMVDSPFELEDQDEGGEDDDDYDDYDYDDHAFGDAGGPTSCTVVSSNGSTALDFRNRIRSDLRAAKEAGFKVGTLGPLLDGFSAYVSISCRIAKLGISEEAKQAWQVEASDYLILLYHYPGGYRTNEQLQAYDTPTLRQSIAMRVGASKSYKPALQQAISAFAKGQVEAASQQDLAPSENRYAFRPVFISSPLNSLLNERLIPLLKYREIGMAWTGAEDFYNDQQGAISGALGKSAALDDKYLAEEPPSHKKLPAIILGDEMKDRWKSEYSLPLLGMQFLLRHFVRCTEFCLVCHRKLTNDLDALKPFVCSEPLCLYQYMSLGFGPSIEHEVVSQPYVVDLLVSFCYASASTGRLKDFPTGLALLVPPSFVSAVAPVSGCDAYRYTTTAAQPTPKAPAPEKAAKPYEKLRYDAVRGEVIFDDPPDTCPVRVGDWVVLQPGNGECPVHCRVSEATFYPTISVGPPVSLAKPGQASLANPATSAPHAQNELTPAATPHWQTVLMEVYNQNFDSLDDNDKRGCVRLLLETLPSVRQMKCYLSHQRSPELKGWVDRLSPASLGLLRWIVASNRACIVQVDQLDDHQAKAEDRLYGMKDWIQFRFAMGAPDKEQRFLDEVKKTTARLGLMYPTLFAWHGSQLSNWHGIIREGLNFNETINGRAFGHGCYHSLDYNTSYGYAGRSYNYGASSGSWPQSMLAINAAMSLNEIVNAPSEFISKSPHLVVAQLDWIQTRYLFVKCTAEGVIYGKEERPVEAVPQDPRYTPVGAHSTSIVIPAKASKHNIQGKRKVVSDATVKSPNKKFKAESKAKDKGAGVAVDPYVIEDDDCDCGTEVDDDGRSVDTDIEDQDILFEEAAPKPVPEVAPPPVVLSSKTDFVPGALDHDTLPRLPEPDYANITATKRLQSDLRELLKVQQNTPLDELGWYVDPEKCDNVYQWIVELHSFRAFKEKGKDIPLVADMKKAGVKSIVLELRFPASYPHAPPFVRVIRPRFLPFMQGGGGHVTAGGAMCMELLTNTGWSAVSTISSVLLQVRLAIASTDPRPARLDSSSYGSSRNRSDYDAAEAAEAYIRACNQHGWLVPEGFKEMAYAVGPKG